MPQNQRIMITNPFIINGNIPSEYFCDRKEESKRLIQMLTNGENVCLMSPRRMGKSKLIQFCYDQEPLCSDYYCFYIDIFHTTSLREFTYTFGRQVFSTLKSKSQKMTLWFVQALKSLSADFGFDPSTGMPTFSLSLGDVHNPEFTLEEIFKVKICLRERAERMQINDDHAAGSQFGEEGKESREKTGGGKFEAHRQTDRRNAKETQEQKAPLRQQKAQRVRHQGNERPHHGQQESGSPERGTGSEIQLKTNHKKRNYG